LHLAGAVIAARRGAGGPVNLIRNFVRRRTMAQKNPDDTHGPIPVMQKILDNPFLLLFLGVVVPTVFYILWGIMEIVSIPLAK
jgi:hypothetical protein